MGNHTIAAPCTKAELRAIADRRDQRRRGDDTDAGDRRKTAARLVGAVPCQKRCLQRLDPGLSRTELLNQHAKCLARQRRQSPIIGIFDDRNQFLHLRRPLSDDQSELRTVAAQCIDHHGALTDQQLTSPVQHQNRLLLRAFRRRKPHHRTRHRLADRFRIRRVILVRLDEGANVLRRDQPDLMAQRLQLTRPVVRTGASLHTDKTGWQAGEECQHLPAPQLPAQHHSTFAISPMNLEHRLSQIKPNRRNIHRGRSLCLKFKVAKVEWHPGELYPRVGFIVTNLSRRAERVVAFYNQRGTAEQHIKEGKNAIKWTRLSCRMFDHNAVRLQLHAVAYNLGNFMRTLALPDAVEQWSLTSLREKLIKIGAKIVRHGRYVTFQMAEVVIPRDLFADILRRIDRLRPNPSPA